VLSGRAGETAAIAGLTVLHDLYCVVRASRCSLLSVLSVDGVAAGMFVAATVGKGVLRVGANSVFTAPDSLRPTFRKGFGSASAEQALSTIRLISDATIRFFMPIIPRRDSSGRCKQRLRDIES
jgi:hypothetical protein